MLSKRHSSSLDENANNTKKLLTTGFKAKENISQNFHWNHCSLQYVSIELSQMSEVNQNAYCNTRQLSPDVLMTIVMQLSF